MLDLHQNAVGELRGQLSQVESMTVGKTQDLEDILLENQGKVGGASGGRGFRWVGLLKHLACVWVCVCGCEKEVDFQHTSVNAEITFVVLCPVVCIWYDFYLVHLYSFECVCVCVCACMFHSVCVSERVLLYLALTLPQVEKLDALVHREIENKAEVEMARNWVMTIVAWTVTFVLHLIAFVLKLSSLMR